MSKPEDILEQGFELAPKLLRHPRRLLQKSWWRV